jgi:hypothetical protein
MKTKWSRICINRIVSACFAILNRNHHESSIDLQNFDACNRYWILCRPCCRPVLQTTFSLTLIGQPVLVQRVSIGVPHKVHLCKEYHSVCPLVGIGTLPTPSLASECAPPPRTRGGGGTLACVEGLGESQSVDWRKSLALCLLCGVPIMF